MNKKEAEDLTTDILISDAIIRLSALEKLLLDKNIFTKEELSNVTAEIVESVSKIILKNVEEKPVDFDLILDNMKKKGVIN
jgi:TPP-dependent pyruvate/acetoin dehydrogenase alpha subunit